MLHAEEMDRLQTLNVLEQKEQLMKCNVYKEYD